MRSAARILTLLALLLPVLAMGFDLKAASAISIDAETGKVLFEKDAHTRRFPASTTKILTAMLLLEHSRPEDVVTAPADIEKVGQSSMHLKPGEKISVRNLLFAIMLRSANDGCYAAAVHVAGSMEAFAEMMNARAKRAGALNSNFVNPNGLNDPNHYTTAYDLAMIARDAMRDPAFREIVDTEKKKIARSVNQGDTVMVNRNKVLRKDPTTDGIKTGWTIPAGHCFVGSATRNGFRVITVVLKSGNWQSDHLGLLRHAYDRYEIQERLDPAQSVGSWPVTGGTLEKVDLYPQVPSHVLGWKGSQHLDRALDLPEALRAPLKRGERVGDLVVRYKDGFEHRVPLVVGEEVPAASLLAATTGGQGSGSFLVIGGLLLGGAWWMRTRARRRMIGYAHTSRSSAAKPEREAA